MGKVLAVPESTNSHRRKVQVLHVVRKLVQRGSIEPLVLAACGDHPRLLKLLSPVNQSGVG